MPSGSRRTLVCRFLNVKCQLGVKSEPGDQFPGGREVLSGEREGFHSLLDPLGKELPGGPGGGITVKAFSGLGSSHGSWKLPRGFESPGVV